MLLLLRKTSSLLLQCSIHNTTANIFSGFTHTHKKSSQFRPIELDNVLEIIRNVVTIHGRFTTGLGNDVVLNAEFPPVCRSIKFYLIFSYSLGEATSLYDINSVLRKTSRTTLPTILGCKTDFSDVWIVQNYIRYRTTRIFSF